MMGAAWRESTERPKLIRLLSLSLALVLVSPCPILALARAQDPVIPQTTLHEAPRVAAERAVPPGFRRMTLEEFLEG